jgi:hypothetical protein
MLSPNFGIYGEILNKLEWGDFETDVLYENFTGINIDTREPYILNILNDDQIFENQYNNLNNITSYSFDANIYSSKLTINETLWILENYSNYDINILQDNTDIDIDIDDNIYHNIYDYDNEEYANSSLGKVIIPNSVTHIGNNAFANNLISELNNSGIAKSDFTTIFNDISWDDFVNNVNAELLEYNLNKDFNSINSGKDYMHFILGLKPKYNPNSFWSSVAENSSLKQIAMSYFKLKNVEMRYYNIWKHEHTDNIETGSQLWHRDREDLKILKIFICIDDVSLNNGPFVYAPGTHSSGKVKDDPNYFKEKDGTKRTTDEMMEKIVLKSDWIYSTGPKGTIILADTNGFHKGGFVKSGQRLLFTCMYVSSASERFYFS